MKILNKSEELLKEVKNNNLINIISFINSDKIIRFINNFIYKPDDDITDESMNVIENTIKLCKHIYEVNEYMTTIKYKLPPDDIYDLMLEKYKSIKGCEPFQSSVPSGMRAIKHEFPELVGTLDKAYDIYDISSKMSVEKFFRKILKNFGRKTLSIMVIPKFDGTSVSVSFECSSSATCMHPTSATSRGDFEENKGVDMTPIISNIRKLDVKRFDTLKYNGLYNNKIGVQYEAIITESGKKKLSEITKTNYSTRRAAIAAAIKRSLNENTSNDERAEINSCISLVPIGVSDNFIEKMEINWYELMPKVGIFFEMYNNYPIFNAYVFKGNIDELLKDFQELAAEYSEKRKELPYSIDGLVISIIDEDIRKELGRSNNKNKWQIAYKFGALIQKTKATGIISSHGKQGYIGHNITFEPIEFNGVRYDKAPVNNLSRLYNLDLRIGDEIIISYNADVMGYLYKDTTCKPNSKGNQILPPAKCDFCGEELIIHKDMLKCTNEDCIGHSIGIISEMVRILDIDFFGDETVEALAKEGINNPIKFLNINKETLSKVLKGKNLDKAWKEFQQKIAAEIDYSKVIDMLRIPSLRTKTAKKIIKHIGINKLIDLMNDYSHEKLEQSLRVIPGIDKNAIVFAHELNYKYPEFYELIHTLNVKSIDEKNYDKVILISGFRKNEKFEEICSRLNYEIIDNGKYDILVVTPDKLYGSKALKARKSGKPIYTLAQFIEKFN